MLNLKEKLLGSSLQRKHTYVCTHNMKIKILMHTQNTHVRTCMYMSACGQVAVMDGLQVSYIKAYLVY